MIVTPRLSGISPSTCPARPSRAEAGTRSFAWPRVNCTGSPLTSWVCAEVTAASVRGRNGSLRSSRATPVETIDRMPSSTVGRKVCNRSGSTATAWSIASCTSGLVMTVLVTRSVIRASTCGRSTIVSTLDTNTDVLITFRRVHSEVLARTRLTALMTISRPETKRRMAVPSSRTGASTRRAGAPASSSGRPGLITHRG